MLAVLLTMTAETTDFHIGAIPGEYRKTNKPDKSCVAASAMHDKASVDRDP